MKNRPLLPGFLRKADNYLLRNKPEIWSARTHLVAWYSLLFIIALSALCYINYTDARLDSNVDFWVGFVTVIAILALVGWIIYLLRFNVFKRFGLTNAASRLITFLLYFITCGIIAAYAFVPLAVETWRAKQQFNIDEVYNDINNINLKITEIEFNRLPDFWRRDTLHIVDSVPATSPKFFNDEETGYVAYDSTKTFANYFITKNDLQYYLSNEDSMIKLNETAYLHFSVPDVQFINDMDNYYNDSNRDILNSAQIYKKAEQNAFIQNKTVTAGELKKLLSKYYKQENKPAYINNDYNNYSSIIQKKYDLPTIVIGVRNVKNKLTRFKGNYGAILFRVWFYISFIVALFMFIYRHSTTKTFFLSLLSAVILSILTSLVTAFSHMDSTAFFVWYFTYFVIFSILVVQSFYIKARSIVNGIAINLWVVMVTFIPLLVVEYVYELTEKRDMVKSMIVTNHEAMHKNLLIAEVAEPILLCILTIIFIHRVYINWYALPEE